jgi:hypothetical protein
MRSSDFGPSYQLSFPKAKNIWPNRIRHFGPRRASRKHAELNKNHPRAWQEFYKCATICREGHSQE